MLNLIRKTIPILLIISFSCGKPSERKKVTSTNESPKKDSNRTSLPTKTEDENDQNPEVPEDEASLKDFEKSVAISSFGISLKGIATKHKNASKAVSILLHDANSNLHEFDKYLKDIFDLGFDILAVDLQNGGNKFDYENLTLKGLKQKNSSFFTLTHDIRAIINYANDDYSKIIVTATGITGAALIKETRTNINVERVAIFSSQARYGGEYIYNHIVEVKVPSLVAAPESEAQELDKLLQAAITKQNITRYSLKGGESGISLLNSAEALRVYLDFISKSM